MCGSPIAAPSRSSPSASLAVLLVELVVELLVVELVVVLLVELVVVEVAVGSPQKHKRSQSGRWFRDSVDWQSPLPLVEE